MSVCIGILEDQLREVVTELDNNKFIYKFLFNTDKYEEFIEELGIKTLTDCRLFSGSVYDIRAARYKKGGRESEIAWQEIIDKLFYEERQIAIVNDYWDNPNMVLVFPKTFDDFSAQRKNITISFSDDICEMIMYLMLKKLADTEGMNTTTFNLYKTSGKKEEDENDFRFFKMKQAKIKRESIDKYKSQIVTNFEEAFKFRLITYYTKLREYDLEDIMRKLNDLGYLDERFNNEIYVYEEEARRLLAKRLCTLSFKNDIDLLIEEGIIDKDKISYSLN